MRIQSKEPRENPVALFCSLIGIGSIFALAHLVFFGNRAQKYTDIIMEWTSSVQSNKSAEIQLLYILVFAGIATICIWYARNKQRQSACTHTHFSTESLMLIFSFTAQFILLIVFSYINQTLAFAMCIGAIFFCKDRTLAIPAVVLFFVSLYAVLGIYRLYVFLGGALPMRMTLLLILAVALSLIPLASKRPGHALYVSVGVLQLFIPLCMLLLVLNKYVHEGATVTVYVSARIRLTVYALVCLCMADTLRKLWQNRRAIGGRSSVDTDINTILSVATCFVVLFVNNLHGQGAIMPSDMHHPYENIISFSQIFSLGQKPYAEYIPVSGMFSVVQGAFLHFFGKDLMAYYWVTDNLFYAFIAAIIVILLRLHIKPVYVFCASLVFIIQDYNRPVFMLPIALLLTLPALVRRRNLWLQVYLFTSFLHGLYYPVYGAAVCAGFLPLAAWQIKCLVTTGDIKRLASKPQFYARWAIVLAPIACGLPLLAGIYTHTKAMGGQTITADGISVFGQKVPSNFFSYLQEKDSARRGIFYVLHFLPQAAAVWLATLLTAEETTQKNAATERLFISLCMVILPIVAYTYTAVRMDVGTFYARCSTVLFVIALLLFVHICKRKKTDALALLTIIFASVIFFLGNSYGINAISGRLITSYAVPADYVQTKTTAHHIGKGFMQKDIFSYIQSDTGSYDAKSGYFATEGSFGYYFHKDVPGVSIIESGTIKGYEAAQESARVLRQTKAVIGSAISTSANYYLYHYIATSGLWSWNDSEKRFYFNDTPLNKSQTAMQNRLASCAPRYVGLGRHAASLGRSFKSLDHAFATVSAPYDTLVANDSVTLNFRKPLWGDDADFLYIEFANADDTPKSTLFSMSGEEVIPTKAAVSKALSKRYYNFGTKIRISYPLQQPAEPNQSAVIDCALDGGKLLIPLGACHGYLLSEHDTLQISAYAGDNKTAVPPIKEIRLLKLRPVE